MGNRTGLNYIAGRGWMIFEVRANKLNQYASWANDYPAHNSIPWGSATPYDDNFVFDGSPWIFPGNGVMMGDGVLATSYNALKQPVSIWSPSIPNTDGQPNFLWFGFDPLGRCVKRWVAHEPATGNSPAGSNPATYFYYDGWNMIQEGVNANAPNRVYVHGARVDEIVASCVWSGSHWAYHHYDARGHCILLTQPTANPAVLERYEYDAFGQPYCYDGATGALLKVNNRAASVWGNRFLFTGREWLSDFGVYDFRNRMYQPQLGRFMQPDLKEFEAGDYNLYRYCHNDPVNRSDPTGLFDTSKDDPEKAKPVLVKDTYRPVLGSSIPAHVRVFSSGNWNDRTVANHASSNLYQETGKGGLTRATGSSSGSGNNVDLTLHVNWYYDQQFAGTNVITRELQHVQDARNLAVRYWSGTAAASLDNLRNFSGIVSGFNTQQKFRYDFGTGAPHDLSTHPAVPTTVPAEDPTQWR